MSEQDDELKRACEIVERHIRAIGDNCQVITSVDGVELAPISWTGSVFEKDLYSAIKEGRRVSHD